MENDAAVRDKLNGAVDELNTSDATNLALSLNTAAGSKRRGKSIIETEESRTSATPGLLTTPDQVTNLVLPTDGLLWIKYSALSKATVLNTGTATIQVGGVQLEHPRSTGASVFISASGNSTADSYGLIYTDPRFFDSVAVQSFVKQGGGAATRSNNPMYFGGFIPIELAAGTYTVTVLWSASAGTVTAKQRRLYAYTQSF
jgi:hypothetical protein